MSDAQQTLSVAREVFEALQAHDLDRFRALLTDDAVLRDPSTGAAQQGPEAVVAAVKGTLDAFPDLHSELTNLFADGDQAVAEVVRTGTHTEALALPGGEVPPTGREVRLPECIILRVRDGQLCAMTAYMDRLHLMDELGLPATRAEPQPAPQAAEPS